ncbi:MAG: hypothetical protein ACYCSP_02300 [Acidobacteriaceae bacterium]
MTITIALSNTKDKNETVKLIPWPANVPLALPSVGDEVKQWPGLYGTVKQRAFVYADDEESLTVELRVEYETEE